MADKTKNPRQDRDTIEKSKRTTNKRDENRDPLSGAPGSHPVGTGIGAASGAAAGAAVGGAVGGPAGFAVGAAAGAVAGGLAGKVAGEVVNPTDEDAYWREHYSTRPYAMRELSYDMYAPAYRYGWEAYALHPGRKWDDVESYLSDGWKHARGMSPLDWEDARGATKDAWERVERKRGDRTRA